MDEILELMNKYRGPMDTDVCNEMRQYVTRVENVMRNQRLQLAENERIIENQSQTISILPEELDKEKKKLEVKLKQLNNETEKLKVKQLQKNRITKGCKALEIKRNSLRTAKQNPKDEYILNLGMKKYDLYKELTRVRWNFAQLDKGVEGFVTNKNSYIRHFSYSKDKTTEELSELVWQEIWLSVKPEISNSDEDKENHK